MRHLLWYLAVFTVTGCGPSARERDLEASLGESRAQTAALQEKLEDARLEAIEMTTAAEVMRSQVDRLARETVQDVANDIDKAAIDVESAASDVASAVAEHEVN
ncbi:hypothetical protein [Sphingomonas crocodyli]|uniref:Lipoprotein n=1 Tax=Sphingomonas crocodyli TaxID=1979270 RepID=A0A437LXY9_9SPHN|nr:hypothetical protein [Sphingomonas crocodyli]RVT90261.1 hypothetical protein EOD43_18395 [Sphingomonas crocodyli]